MRLARLLTLAALALAAAVVKADEAAEVRALMTRGEPSAALQRAERASAANPQDPQLRFLHGVALMDLQRDAAALEIFTALSQEYPELADPLNNIALLRARAGEYELARQALELALRSDPGHRLARANLGQVHLLLAVQAWERLGALAPLAAPLQRQLDGARALLAGAVQPGR